MICDDRGGRSARCGGPDATKSDRVQCQMGQAKTRSCLVSGPRPGVQVIFATRTMYGMRALCHQSQIWRSWSKHRKSRGFPVPCLRFFDRSSHIRGRAHLKSTDGQALGFRSPLSLSHSLYLPGSSGTLDGDVTPISSFKPS